MKRKISSILALAAILLLSAGCSNKNKGPENSSFHIDEQYLSFDFTQTQEMVFIPVQTDISQDQWSVSSSDDTWCRVSKSFTSEKGIQIAVTESTEPDVRQATVNVSAAGTKYEIAVRQLGYGPAILVSDKTVEATGGDMEMAVTSNIEYKIGEPVHPEGDQKWITRKDVKSRAFAEEKYLYRCEANTNPFIRKATIDIVAKDPAYKETSVKCTVTQKTASVSISDMPQNVKVIPISAADNQHHDGTDASNLIDGNFETAYHSPWGVGYDNPTTMFPVLLDFKFDGTKDIDYFVLHSGTSGSNGLFGKFDVYYKTEGDTGYKALNTEDSPFDFGKRGGRQTAYFNRTLEKVTDIRLSVRDGSGDNGAGTGEGFVAAKEIEFYESSSVSTLHDALLAVFTDLSCMQLKAGITRSDVTTLYSVSPFFAQEVAARLLENTYDEFEYDFRAQTYKPYSDNAINRQILTKKYSRMDNPTGIEVKTGDELIVCVDKIPAGQSVSLAVFGEQKDGFCANYGGMYEDNAYETVDQEEVLTTGVNTIKITASGMCYVMNTARPLSRSSESVKVHILPKCGTVQGYFDLERHKTDEKYQELLAHTTYKYFVAKGKKMIFNFHTSQLRKDSPTGILSGLQAWDDIVSWQQELMGIADCEYFNNHIMAVSTTDPNAYMDASNRRVNFATSALYKIISREQLNAAEDNTWGPAHELGHVNQGAINWKSTTESSNNLFSNYAIYKMGVYGSRGDALNELALSWTKKECWPLMGGSTHMNEDTELHMRMNWQLWNYYHRCEFKPDFWPRLFQILRDDPLPSEYSSNDDPGASQLKFAVAACKAAGEDLTEFFETWGFFRDIDITYEQYGKARYLVTKDMIASTKAQIKALGLPAAAPIQYIEDRKTKGSVLYCDMGYYTTFKDKTKISKTIKYTVSNRTYTVSDCDQAVAVELRKPASGENLGELLYFSNLAKFTVPDGVEVANAVLYAVQYDGKRIKINK